MATFDFGITIEDSASVSSSANGYSLQVTGSTLLTGSFSINGVSVNSNLLPSYFSHSFASNPSNELFLQIPATDTSANAPVHYQFSWTMISGSTYNSNMTVGSSYFVGTYNGGSNVFISDIYQKRLSSAPGVTMSVSLGGNFYNISAAFTGSGYRMSGSYVRVLS